MVVQGRVTELLDLKGIIQKANPSFFGDSGSGSEIRDPGFELRPSP
jgi:hypothetical protein